MKTLQVNWLLVALVAAISCGKETPTGEPKPADCRIVELQAALDNDTKASVTGSGVVSWSDDDKIAVWTSSEEARTFSMVGISGGYANFQAYLDVNETPESLAVYPVRSFVTLTNGVATIFYPYTYTYREGGMDAPMGAIINNGTLVFQHLGGVIRVACSNVPASATRFNLVANGQQIVGNFDLTVETGMSAITRNNSSYTKAIVNFSPGTGSKTFNVTIPTGHYNSIYAYFSDSSDHKLYEWQVLSDVTIARGDMFVRSMPEDIMRVMSFNIRFAHDEDSYTLGDGRLWDERKLVVPVALGYRFFDVMGTQENTTGQIDDILTNLSGYSALGTSNNGYSISSLGYTYQYETSAIYYRNSVTVLDSGSFDITQTHTRRCNWAKLNFAGHTFYLFNAHFQVGESTSYASQRKAQAATILTEIGAVSSSYPVILTGDFNCWDATDDDVIKYILDEGTMRDARSDALNPHGSSGTLQYFQANNPATHRVDYVFVNDGFDVQSFWIDNSQQKNAPAWESDHNPVIVDLSWSD